MLFPGHNYLGPGNPVDNGEPVDEDDLTAQIHDRAYESANSDSDIREADKVAIFDFAKEAVLHNNWHAGIGAIGLGAKYALESVTGVLYPNVSIIP